MPRFAGVRRVATNFYHILTGKQLRANTKQWIRRESTFEVRRFVPLGPEVPTYVHFANGNDYTGRKEPSVVVNGALQAQTTQIDSVVLRETKDAVDNFLSEGSALVKKINNYNNTKFKWLRNSIIALAGSVVGALAYPFWGLTNLPGLLPMTFPKWAGFVIAGAEWFGALMLGFYVLFGLLRKLPKWIGIQLNARTYDEEEVNIRNLCKDTSKKEALAYVLSDLSKDKKNGEVRSVLRVLEKEDAAKVNAAMKSFETSEEEPAEPPPRHPLDYTPPPPEPTPPAPQPAFPAPPAPRPARRADARVAKPVEGILRTKDDTPPHAQVVAPTPEATPTSPDTVIEPLPKGAQVAPAPPPEKPKEPDRQELALSKFIEAKKPSRDDYYNAAKVVRIWKPSTDKQEKLLEEAKKRVLAHDPAFLLGKTFGGYEIMRRLGKGSMGMLYIVRKIDGADKDEMQVAKFPGLNILREKVEIERVFRENIDDKDLQKRKQIYDGLMRRFNNEAERILNREIDHPNIISVLDMGTAFNLEIDGAPKEIPYYIAEYIKGRTLRWLAQQKMDIAVLVREVFIPITDALKHMHTHKTKQTGKEEPFIHRDIKPTNVMAELTPVPDKKIKIKRSALIDFGTLRPPGGTETQSDQRLGTWKYMDRDYALKGTEGLTPKSDLISWALTMVETIVGELPWQEIVDQPKSLRDVKEFRSNIPEELLEIFERMYQKGYEYHDDIINAFNAWLLKQEELPREERAVTKEKTVKAEEPSTPVLGEAEGVDTEPAGGLQAESLFGDVVVAPGSVEDAQKLIKEIGSELEKKPAPKRLLQINDQLAEIQKTFPGEEKIEGELAEMMIKVSELLEGED